MARVDSLGHFLTDVADAIRTKGGTSETIQASSFDTAIENLPSGGGSYAPKFISFRDYTGEDLTYETQNLDTSNITSMKYMFSNCTNLTLINILGFDTSNVTDMTNMFSSCSSLTSINCSSFDTKNVTLFTGMFRDCPNLTSLDLSNFDATSCTTTSNMFINDTNLASVDLRNFALTGSKGVGYMFSGCSSLMHLDVRSIWFGQLKNTNTMFNNVPNACEIIVMNDNVKTWFANNYSRFTNVKTVAEYEAE